MQPATVVITHRVVAAGLIAAVGLSGCAALPAAAVAVAAVQASTGAAIKAGTEYRLGGAALRTFAAPLGDVEDAVRGALDHMAMPIDRDEGTIEGQQIAAQARERVIEITLTPITPATTTMKVVVKQGMWRRDRATASEIIAQIEQLLASQASALSR